MDKSQIPQSERRWRMGSPHPLAKLDIEVVVASEVDGTRPWAGLPRDNVWWYTRLYLAKEGHGRVCVNGEDLDLEPRRFYLLPSNRAYTFFESPDFGHHYVHLTATVSGGPSLFRWIDCPFEHVPEDYTSAVAAMRQIRELPGSDWRVQLQRKAIVSQLLQPFFDRATVVDDQRLSTLQRMRPVIRYVERHLGDPVRLSDLAELVSLHPTYFSNLFCDCFGTPPQAYVISRRLARAQLLLQTSDLPIKNIAAEVGFSDPYHFTKIFRQKVGMAPTQYRQRAETGG